MKKITIETAVKAAKGELITGKLENIITGVSIDSRKAEKGNLFVAIKGERTDGHAHIAGAVKQDAGAVFLSDINAVTPELLALAEAHNTALIRTEDTVKAFQDLSAEYLNLFNLKKVGVTGSTGKTTTKEMIYTILSERWQTTRSLGNFNNELGLPLTIFTLRDDDQAGVFEMGMGDFGDVHLLADIVRPDVAVIINIGTAHIHVLGSKENILKAKLEITDFFDEKNTLIIGSDGELLTAENVRKNSSGNYQLTTAGQQGAPDFLLSDIQDFGEEGIGFSIFHDGTSQYFRLSVPGIHNAYDAVCAVAVCSSLGITLEEAALGLTKLQATDKRMNIKEGNGLRVIDDTYNAAPISMKAGMDTLMGFRGERRVVILGDMIGLADQEEKYHREIGEYAFHKGIDVVISVGENCRVMAEGALTGMKRENVSFFETKEQLYQKLGGLVKKGDVILVKGSRALEMEQIVDWLLKQQ